MCNGYEPTSAAPKVCVPLSRIFLSHSSVNNVEAVALSDWLRQEGWDDLFLDVDPERGIAAGERWERKLHEAARRCEAVLFIVSRAWLASDWCLKEFNLAHRLNKRLFGVLVEDIPIAELPVNLTSTWQLVRLGAGRDHVMLRAVLPVTGEQVHITFSSEGLARLKHGLRQAGLDPRFFAWPPEVESDRPPYRGLRPLEAEDAGIFFGREAPIIEALDRLRGLRAAAPPRLMVILGASGAGKSSFLRAGLLPRLARDDRSFLPLPVLRPERAAITGETGLVRTLEAACRQLGMPRTRAAIRAAVADPVRLGNLLTELAATGAPEATAATKPMLVLSIDQAEELFLAEGADEAATLLTLLQSLLTADAPAVLVLATMRSDSYERLQMAPALEGIHQETISLPPMPRGAYQQVIEGPAARLTDRATPLKIEPALTEALLTDIETGGSRDALPLLAFALERLYLEYGAAGSLTLDDYILLGRIGGSIEAAVEQALSAADANPKIPRDRGARLVLLRRGLIPWLAGVDPDTRSPRRNIARRSEIPPESAPLIDLLVEERLLVSDIRIEKDPLSGAEFRVSTIEPAHEALLRQWGLLEDWVAEDFALLAIQESVKRAARDWAANGYADAWLAHQEQRLVEARALEVRTDLAAKFDSTDRAYLAQCLLREESLRIREERRRQEREDEQQRRLSDAQALAISQRKIARRTKHGIYASLALMSLAAILAWISISRANEANQQRQSVLIAQSRYLADLSTQNLALQQRDIAVLLALSALPANLKQPERPIVPEAVASLIAGSLGPKPRWTKKLFSREVLTLAVNRGGTRVAAGSADGRATLLNTAAGEVLVEFPKADAVLAMQFSPDGTVLATSNGNRVDIWKTSDGSRLASLTGHLGRVTSLSFSSDGTRLATASVDRTARIWSIPSGDPGPVAKGHLDLSHPLILRRQ